MNGLHDYYFSLHLMDPVGQGVAHSTEFDLKKPSPLRSIIIQRQQQRTVGTWHKAGTYRQAGRQEGIEGRKGADTWRNLKVS